ncbi:MAG: hypothetical protein HY053_03470 [Proteobacteria bacterium]|nr:hypothetical protein [Pseudomonadota bacterium]
MTSEYIDKRLHAAFAGKEVSVIEKTEPFALTYSPNRLDWLAGLVGYKRQPRIMKTPFRVNEYYVQKDDPVVASIRKMARQAGYEVALNMKQEGEEEKPTSSRPVVHVAVHTLGEATPQSIYKVQAFSLNAA